MAANVDKNFFTSVWKHVPNLNVFKNERFTYLGTFKRQYYTPVCRSEWKHRGANPIFRLSYREWKAITPSFIPKASGPIDPGCKQPMHPMNPKIKIVYRIQIGPKTRPC